MQGVNSYGILSAGMSNVWKRYLFANPVTINKVLNDFMIFDHVYAIIENTKLELPMNS